MGSDAVAAWRQVGGRRGLPDAETQWDGAWRGPGVHTTVAGLSPGRTEEPKSLAFNPDSSERLGPLFCSRRSSSQPCAILSFVQLCDVQGAAGQGSLECA